MITLNQTHSKKFHCTYLLHYYPFDTQVDKLQQEEELVRITDDKSLIMQLTGILELVSLLSLYSKNIYLGLSGAPAAGTICEKKC